MARALVEPEQRRGEQDRPRREITPQLIDRLVGWKKEEHDGYSFEQVWEAAAPGEDKFALAIALLDDGRISENHEPQILAKNFIRRGRVARPEETVLRDKIWFDLVKRGIIEPDSDEAKFAQDEVWRFIDSDEKLQKLGGHLDNTTLGALATVQIFKDASDDQKRSARRQWTIQSLIRPHLGETVRFTRPRGEISFRSLFQLVPTEVFEDSDQATLQIVKNCFAINARQMFYQSEEEGFSRLKAEVEAEIDEVRKAFLQSIYDDFSQGKNVAIPEVFNEKVTWLDDTPSDEEPPSYPHFLHKYGVWEVQNSPSRAMLFNGGTGSGKTGLSFLTAAALGIKKATIIGPAIARDTWPEEAGKIFKKEHTPEVFTIGGIHDLQDPRVISAPAVYISSEFLGQNYKAHPEIIREVVQKLAVARGTDGVFLDESSVFQHEDTNTSRAMMELVTTIRDSYERSDAARRDVLGKPLPLPVLALTATPLTGSSLKELDPTMAILYPDRFALPGQITTVQGGKPLLTFSEHCMDNPEVAHSVLFGEKLMMQFTQRDLFGEKAPVLSYERVPVSMSPSQRVIYEWARGLEEDSLTQIRMLTDVLFNPQLIKKTCHDREIVPEPVYATREDLTNRLLQLYEAWGEWELTRDQSIPHEPFSEDWIAKYGDDEFIIQCFFDDTLLYGVDSLVDEAAWKKGDFAFIKRDWMYKRFECGETEHELVSEKYRVIHDIIKQSILQNADGTYSVTRKVFVVDPLRRRGLTRWIDDPRLKDEDYQDNAWSLYETIRTDWFPGMPESMAASIDGSKSFAERRATAKIWRESGTESALVVADMKSVYQSMDWAVRDTEDNKNVEEINVIFPEWPWSWSDFEQMCGRFLRPGLAKKVNIYILESQDSLDQGFHDTVRLKELYRQVGLHGISLTVEQREFVDSKKSAPKMLTVEPQAGQLFIQFALPKLRGIGEEGLADELSRLREGRPYYDIWAESYFLNGQDRYRIVGNNAEVMKRILTSPQDGTMPERVLSLGAGTCLFSRSLLESGYRIHVDNLDINPAVLSVAKERYPDIGNVLVGRVSNLSAAVNLETNQEYKIASEYDAVDCSFMLDMTNLYDKKGKIVQTTEEIERVKVLQEIHRVVKQNGTVALSFSESTFDEETFITFANTLIRHFGFNVLESSGRTEALDTHPPKQIGWVLTLQKTGSIDISTLDPNELRLCTDDLTGLSRYKAKNGKQSSRVRVDYPLYQLSQFRIINPISGEISTPLQVELPIVEANDMVGSGNSGQESNGSDSEEVLIATIRAQLQIEEDQTPIVEQNGHVEVVSAQNYSLVDVKEDLRSLDRDDQRRRLWISSVRRIHRQFGINYEKAEEILYAMLHEGNIRKPSEWNTEALRLQERIINREISMFRKTN